jgi:hypothetical protein
MDIFECYIRDMGDEFTRSLFLCVQNPFIFFFIDAV